MYKRKLFYAMCCLTAVLATGCGKKDSTDTKNPEQVESQDTTKTDDENKSDTKNDTEQTDDKKEESEKTKSVNEDLFYQYEFRRDPDRRCGDRFFK